MSSYLVGFETHCTISDNKFKKSVHALMEAGVCIIQCSLHPGVCCNTITVQGFELVCLHCAMLYTHTLYLICITYFL